MSGFLVVGKDEDLWYSLRGPVFKFPKTPRVTKTLQQENVHQEWRHLNAVIQEKVDGANVGISFEEGYLKLQSRGHYLVGGLRERQFDLFKRWAYLNVQYLEAVLSDRYVLYGEWLYAKHHIFYDALDHYFLAYDLFDKIENKFLSTHRVHARLGGIVKFVPILHQAKFGKIHNFTQYIGPSRFRTKDWKERLVKVAGEKELDHTDQTQLMEGIYVRVEDDEWIVGRMKHPREEFTKVLEDDSHWLTRPIVTNQLRPGVVI